MRSTKAVNLSGSSKAWTHTDWSDRPPPSPTHVPPKILSLKTSQLTIPHSLTHSLTHSLARSLCRSLSLSCSLQPQCTKHQSVFSPSTLGPLSHLQVPLKAPTVAPASVHATPSPATGTADKDPVWEWGMRRGRERGSQGGGGGCSKTDGWGSLPTPPQGLSVEIHNYE